MTDYEGTVAVGRRPETRRTIRNSGRLDRPATTDPAALQGKELAIPTLGPTF